MTARARNLVLLFCAFITVLAGITPTARILRTTELGYNEGWNVAAAMRLAPGAAHNPQLPFTTGASPLTNACCQTQLYPAAWGWTTVNYPVGSFALVAPLHSLTHNDLLTGRFLSLLSLVACSALLGLIARALGATRRATLLTVLLCLAIISVCAIDYAGVDDPQLLGDALFLLALFVYVRHRASGPVNAGQAEATYATVTLTASLFVIAGSVKQSPIDFPIAVLLDLLLLSKKKAAWFTACGLAFGLLAGIANRHVGGPWFVQQLLLGRLYSATKARDVAVSVLGPMLIPLLLAGYTAWHLRSDPRRRIAAILLLTSILTGTYFGGGSGVAGNALFTALFAIVCLLGLLFTQTEALPRLNLALPILAFTWLLIPALVQSVANPLSNLQAAKASEIRFATATNLLQQHPGPALCESILLCLRSGKPYIFDPFNANRLLLQGKLSQPALLADIAAHSYAVIQLHAPATQPDDLFRERFTPATLAAIDGNYTLALQTPDAAIYVPRTTR